MGAMPAAMGPAAAAATTTAATAAALRLAAVLIVRAICQSALRLFHNN